MPSTSPRVSSRKLATLAAGIASAVLIFGATPVATPIADPPTTMPPITGNCSGRWQPPKVTLATAIDAVFNSLSKSAGGSGPTYLMVNTLGTEVSKRPLRVLTASGVDVGVPAGDFEFAFPQGAVSGDGALHMVWGEPDSVESRQMLDWMTMRIRSLWTATYDPARREWSRPKQLHRTQWASISWTRANTVSWSGDRAMLTATVPLPDVGPTPGSPPPGYAILLDLDSTWHARKFVVPGQRHPGRASAIRLSDRTIVAVSGPVENAGREIRIMEITGDQVSVATSFPRAGQIEHLSLFDDGTRGLHVVWKESNRMKASFAHIGADARGKQWSAPAELSMGRPTGNERFALDACGTVHATLEMGAEDGRFGLYELRFAKVWQSPELMYPDLAARNADILAVPDGTMMLAFQGSLTDQSGGSLIGHFRP